MPDKELTPMMEMIEDVDKLLTDPEIQKYPLKYKAIGVIRNQAIQLKEKERQMVIDAYIIGIRNVGNSFSYEQAKKAEQYYTQTYKS